MKFLITGGAGFIGSALCRYLVQETGHSVLNLDKMTYAGCSLSVDSVACSDRYRFVKGDIADADLLETVFNTFQPDKVIHLAAESHVDRSVDSPRQFIETNVLGTFELLQASLKYYRSRKVEGFMFHHVSTDEVYGSLGAEGQFTESTPYAPSSPYSATKSASDHLVRAWHTTYGLPTLVTNCSNNYGPHQYPEKLIPLTILNALEGRPIPIYGNGLQVRDWLYVEDHVRALYLAATEGEAGQTYNIGGNCERTNLQVVEGICPELERKTGRAGYRTQITHVVDRPGHDTRYAIDASKIERELGWRASESFESGLARTVDWYLSNRAWCHAVEGTGAARGRQGTGSAVPSPMALAH